MADWDRLLGGNIPAEKSMKNDSDGCVIAEGDSLDMDSAVKFAKAWHDVVMNFDWTTVRGAMETGALFPAEYDWSGQLKDLKEDLSRALSKNAGDYSEGRNSYRECEFEDALDNGHSSEDALENVVHTSGILSIGNKRGIYDDDFSGLLRAIEEADHAALLDPAGGKITWENIVSTADPFNQDSTLSKDESHTLGGGAVNWDLTTELLPNINPLEQKIATLEEAIEQLWETVDGLQALVQTFINEPQKG